MRHPNILKTLQIVDMAEKNKKKQLGKGIRALLATMEEEQSQDLQSISKELSKNVAQVPIDWIQANPQQPRTEFDAEAIEGLAASIKVHGIIQPLTLRRLGDETYQIIGSRTFPFDDRAVVRDYFERREAVDEASKGLGQKP